MHKRYLATISFGTVLGLVLALAIPALCPQRARAAFDESPTNWIAGWALANSTCSVPVATFSELSTGEADGDTGDVRKVCYAICEHLYDTYTATSSSNRPTTMRINRNVSASSDGTLTYTYSLQFDMAVTGADVTDE